MFTATSRALYKASWTRTLGKAATKRKPLTSKKVGKGYYKGMGGTKEGWHTSLGRYVIDPARQLNIVAPEFDPNFKLKPYIAQAVSKRNPAKLYGETPP